MTETVAHSRDDSLMRALHARLMTTVPELAPYRLTVCAWVTGACTLRLDLPDQDNALSPVLLYGLAHAGLIGSIIAQDAIASAPYMATAAIDYLAQPASLTGTLIADAAILKPGKRVSYAQCRILHEDAHDVIAQATATFARRQSIQD